MRKRVNIPQFFIKHSNAVIAGSSNLTGSGLASNLELNLEDLVQTFEKAQKWFMSYGIKLNHLI